MNLVGKLFEYNNEIQILEKVWIKMKLNKKNNYGINDHNNDELKIIIIDAEFSIKD